MDIASNNHHSYQRDSPCFDNSGYEIITNTGLQREAPLRLSFTGKLLQNDAALTIKQKVYMKTKEMDEMMSFINLKFLNMASPQDENSNVEWNRRFKTDCHYVYTDGVWESDQAGGIGVYHGPYHKLNRSEKVQLPNHYNCDTTAIKRALHDLESDGTFESKSIVIRTDCIQAIHSITRYMKKLSISYGSEGISIPTDLYDIIQSCCQFRNGVYFQYVYSNDQPDIDFGNEAAYMFACLGMCGDFIPRSKKKHKAKNRQQSRDNIKETIEQHSVYVQKFLIPISCLTLMKERTMDSQTPEDREPVHSIEENVKSSLTANTVCDFEKSAQLCPPPAAVATSVIDNEIEPELEHETSLYLPLKQFQTQKPTIPATSPILNTTGTNHSDRSGSSIKTRLNDMPVVNTLTENIGTVIHKQPNPEDSYSAIYRPIVKQWRPAEPQKTRIDHTKTSGDTTICPKITPRSYAWNDSQQRKQASNSPDIQYCDDGHVYESIGAYQAVNNLVYRMDLDMNSTPGGTVIPPPELSSRVERPEIESEVPLPIKNEKPESCLTSCLMFLKDVLTCCCKT